MLYAFGLGCNIAETTKYICYAKSEGIVHQSNWIVQEISVASTSMIRQVQVIEFR